MRGQDELDKGQPAPRESLLLRPQFDIQGLENRNAALAADHEENVTAVDRLSRIWAQRSCHGRCEIATIATPRPCSYARAFDSLSNQGRRRQDTHLPQTLTDRIKAFQLGALPSGDELLGARIPIRE